MSDFPSMHARDAAKLPHVSLDELSARVPRASALIQDALAKRSDPNYLREYKRRRISIQKKTS
jgi:hypothetical protein